MFKTNEKKYFIGVFYRILVIISSMKFDRFPGKYLSVNILIFILFFLLLADLNTHNVCMYSSRKDC